MVMFRGPEDWEDQTSRDHLLPTLSLNSGKEVSGLSQVLASTVQEEIQALCPGLPHPSTLDAGEHLLWAFWWQSWKGGREGLTSCLCPSGLRRIRDRTLSTEYLMGGGEECLREVGLLRAR